MPRVQRRPLRILTWHVHGSYLDLLIHTGHEFFLPVRDEGRERQGGSRGWGWPTDRVHEVPRTRSGISTSTSSCSSTSGTGARTARGSSPIGSSAARASTSSTTRRGPTPPRCAIRSTIRVLLVHVTAFNQLMWDNGRTPTRVIEHGVVDAGVRWTGWRHGASS